MGYIELIKMGNLMFLCGSHKNPTICDARKLKKFIKIITKCTISNMVIIKEVMKYVNDKYICIFRSTI